MNIGDYLSVQFTEHLVVDQINDEACAIRTGDQRQGSPEVLAGKRVHLQLGLKAVRTRNTKRVVMVQPAPRGHHRHQCLIVPTFERVGQLHPHRPHVCPFGGRYFLR